MVELCRSDELIYLTFNRSTRAVDYAKKWGLDVRVAENVLDQVKKDRERLELIEQAIEQFTKEMNDAT